MPGSHFALTRRVFGITIVMTIVGAACADFGVTEATSTARGVVVDVDGASLQRLASFTVRTDDGQVLTFVPAANFNANEPHAMSPGHMREHMALAVPVIVTYRRDGDGHLVALTAIDG